MGAFNVKTTVLLSGYSTLSTFAKRERLAFFSSVARAQEYFTSSEVTSRPLTGAMLWNFTPARRWKVYLSPSAEISNFSPRSPTGFASEPRTAALYFMSRL